MIFKKCSLRDGTVNGLAGLHWVVTGGWQSALPSVQFHVNRTEKSNSSCLAFHGSLLLVSSWWPHQVEEWLGTMKTWDVSWERLCTTEIHRGLLGPGAELLILEEQAAWGSCQQQQDGHVGHPLSSVQIQDERLVGDWGPFTLSEKKGSGVGITNISFLFWRSKETTQILCQSPASIKDFGF